MKRSVLVILLFFAGISHGMAQDSIRLPCEVLEVSPPFQTDSSVLNQTHYILIHHANATDREVLSKWLKANSGKEVWFIVNDMKYKGVLCRMPHCFGRGLLVHINGIKLKDRDIIDVILPTTR